MVAGQQFMSGLDDIGNRRTAATAGDQFGVNLHSQNYSVNNLNQYTQRTVPGFVDVLGTVASNATVIVNNQATYRKGEYFRGELNFNNTANSIYPSVTNLAALSNGTNADIVTSVTGKVFLPKTPETFGYDADGNLTNDGRWALTWDGENRLVSQTSLTTGPSDSRRKLEFAYDSQSRRIEKKVSTWNGSAYVAQSTNRFIYDAWNLIAILNPQSSILQSFMWGLDLSGTMQGAGGVGGLLWINDLSTYNQPSTHFASYDGNGNVTVLMNATNGAASANYEYGPFGELIRATGLMAKANPFRLSTKYQDDESDLLYYGYRRYNPSVGRWLSREAIGEQAFYRQYRKVHSTNEEWAETPPASSNPHLFIGNTGPNNTDMDGCRMTPRGDVAIDANNRRNAPSGMKLIKVPKCTIVFIYGHNFVNDFTKEGLQWIWNIVPERDSQKDCSYAVVAGCSANLVPNEIPLPGFSYANYDLGDQGTITVTQLLQMWNDTRNKFAPQSLNSLKDCSCMCKQVTLMWVKIGGGLPDLQPDIGTVPLPK